MFTIYSERIREAMELRGASQKWLANASQTTEATISRYLSTSSCPNSLLLLKNIAVALNVSTDFLLGITNESQPKETLPAELKTIIDIWSEISDDDKRVLWALLDKYLSKTQKEKLGNGGTK